MSPTVRFLHTADWQIGMTRHYLSAEAQARFTAGRAEVVRRLGELAAREACDFMVVAGDVFEHDQVSPRTVRRAVDALRAVPVPVYLLPGNHDHLGPASLWSSSLLRQELPGHVHVLDRTGATALTTSSGTRVELVAAPWYGKHPEEDPVRAALATVPEPAEDVLRILVGHGAVDVLDPGRETPRRSAIRWDGLREALDAGRIHHVALGDRHSRTRVGDDPAIWYSGAPEPTDWREETPGEALVVSLERRDPAPGEPAARRAHVTVDPHPVAAWRYHSLTRRVDHDEDLDALEATLAAVPDKERALVRLELSGVLGLAQHARLEDLLTRYDDLLGAMHLPGHRHKVLLAGADDFAELDLSGFLAGAADEIRDRVDAAEGADTNGEDVPFVPGRPDDADSARDALTLLYRLTRGADR